MKENSNNIKTIEIPVSLFDRIATRIENSEFQSVSDYVVHALRGQLAKEESKTVLENNKEDTEKIKERLKALGYL